MPKNAAALTIACSFLEEAIENRIRLSKQTLPPIAVLANQANVSYVSMWKAVRSFVKKGVLSARPRGGINIESALFRNVSRPVNKEYTGTEKKWHLMFRRVKRDILNGVYRGGTILPSKKWLCEKYGMCYKTIQKGLKALVEDGVLEYYKKKYRVRTRDNLMSHARICFLSPGDRHGNLFALTPRVQSYIKELQRECLIYGISMDIVTCEKKGGTLYRNAAPVTNLSSSDFIGAVARHPMLAERFLELSRGKEERRLQIPVALLDETGDKIPPELVLRDSLRVFPLASTKRAGKIMAEFFLMQGHQKAAFISPFHQTTWSRQRWEGVAEAFVAAGAEIVLFDSHLDEFYSEISEEVRTVQTLVESMASSLQNNDRYAKDFLPLVNELSRNVSLIESAALGRQLEPLLDEAYACENVSLWIGVDDTVALHCLQYLKKKTSEKMGVIAVAGFDNSPESFYRKLTSFDFNTNAVMRAVIQYLVSPEIDQKQAKGIIREREIEGVIVERESTLGIAFQRRN